MWSTGIKGGGGWESDPGLPVISQRLRAAPGANRIQRKNPRNHQEVVRKRASEVGGGGGGGASTAGGISINTKQMQNTEGVCANMKQACVFTARGADGPDGGGPCGGTRHLSSL